MSKIIVTTEEELEALVKRVLNEVLQPLLIKGDNGILKAAGEIMTIKQTSEYLCMAVQTLYGKTSKREIPHFKKGKMLYFKREELVQWLTEGKRKTQDEIMREADEYLVLRKRRKT